MILTNEEQSQIREKIRSIEANTFGEILIVINKQVTPSSWVSLYLGFISMILFSNGLIFWGFNFSDNFFYLLGIIIFLNILSFLIGYFLGKIPLFQRLLIPSVIQDRFVYLASLNFFYSHHVSRTPSRSGVLVFISLFEREVVILVDEGIQKKITQEQLKEIVKKTTPYFKKQSYYKGIESVLNDIENILMFNFQKSEKKENELHQELIIIE